VVFGLSSPVMGGFSRWNILGDDALSSTIAEAFAAPPEIHAGFLAEEADTALRRAAPLMWAVTRARGVFRPEVDTSRVEQARLNGGARRNFREYMMRMLRALLFDGFGRA
jgi:tRNA(adenine34) deaminase